MPTRKELIEDPSFPVYSLTKLKSLIDDGTLELDTATWPRQITQESIDRYLDNMNQKLDQLLTIQEAAKLFSGKSNVYVLVRYGFLEKVVILGRTYITKKSINAYEKFKVKFN